jgi:Fe2+ or Zn2+ uptake regulation protein
MLEWELGDFEKDNAIHEARLQFDQNLEKIDQLMTDSLAIKIVAMTITRDLTVQEIKDNLDVSIVTCYGVVKQLRDVGLLAEVGKSRTSTHGLSTLYTATIKTSLIRLTEGRLEMLYIFKDGTVRSRVEQVFDEKKLESSRKRRPVKSPPL